MPDVTIKDQRAADDGWQFWVEVRDDRGAMRYAATVGRAYWERLTAGRRTPEDLVRHSFEFLLAREPKESILREFSLPEIVRYFPEYEESIRRWKP